MQAAAWQPQAQLSPCPHNEYQMQTRFTTQHSSAKHGTAGPAKLRPHTNRAGTNLLVITSCSSFSELKFYSHQHAAAWTRACPKHKQAHIGTRKRDARTLTREGKAGSKRADCDFATRR